MEAGAFMAPESRSDKIQRFSAGGRIHTQSNMAHAPQAGAPNTRAFRVVGWRKSGSFSSHP